ncbi:hypothetical protein BAZMOX_354429_1 [methanotrophic endosymbiont of Bathymodiolus azoricus (Menez Gwen)]|nr:hypothetical protein BAZMOX_354429_1 [methanotrophic endosymbiont of Bathymodiolus azoricus (Menez Gwen)]
MSVIFMKVIVSLKLKSFSHGENEFFGKTVKRGSGGVEGFGGRTVF